MPSKLFQGVVRMLAKAGKEIRQKYQPTTQPSMHRMHGWQPTGECRYDRRPRLERPGCKPDPKYRSFLRVRPPNHQIRQTEGRRIIIWPKGRRNRRTKEVHYTSLNRLIGE